MFLEKSKLGVGWGVVVGRGGKEGGGVVRRGGGVELRTSLKSLHKLWICRNLLTKS